MPLLIKNRFGLAAKLAVCVIASTAAFFALFGYLNLRMERTHYEELIKQSAYRVADVIMRATHYQMLANDREQLIQHDPRHGQRKRRAPHPPVQQRGPDHPFHRSQ